MDAFSKWVSNLLNNPLRVLIYCCVFAGASLLFSGNLIRLYRLDRDTVLLNEQILKAKQDIAMLDKQMRIAKDPAFIGRQAMDLYDFAEEDDLVFVFSE
jgi:hypothetical protein